MSQLHRSLERPAFYAHKWHAKARGIPFEFTYAQWLAWWELELAKRGPKARRGSRRLNYGMCRFLDRGAYAVGNVYCGRPKHNRADYCVSVYLNAPLIRAGSNSNAPCLTTA